MNIVIEICLLDWFNNPLSSKIDALWQSSSILKLCSCSELRAGWMHRWAWSFLFFYSNLWKACISICVLVWRWHVVIALGWILIFWKPNFSRRKTSLLCFLAMIKTIIIILSTHVWSWTINLVNAQLMIRFSLALFRFLPLWVAWTLAVRYFWVSLCFFTFFLCMTCSTTTTANRALFQDSWCLRYGWMWAARITSFLLILMAWTWDSSWWFLTCETLILGLIMFCQRITIYKLINLWHQVLPILIIQILACSS